MVCPLSQNYSSPMDYQYYLVVTLKGNPLRKPPREYHCPPPQKKRVQNRPPPPPPPPPQKTKKKNKKKTKNKTKTRTQRKNEKKKKKKRELSLRILPRRNRLLTSLYGEKARKAWPTATILNEIFEFSEIYVCQKY